MLFIRLHDLGLGCHGGPIFAGSFCYADEGLKTLCEVNARNREFALPG